MRKFLVLILLLAPGPAFAQSNVGADTNPPVGAVYTWMGPTLGAHFINGPPSGQVVNNLAGPFPSPPPVMWDLVRNTINSFPLLAENLSGNFFGMQASVGAVEIPSGATSPGGLAAGIGGYARQNSAAASPLNAVGVYGQGSTTVSNAAGSLWGGNFLVSNGPHSDGDTTGFSLAAMWGVESNVNVKSTNSGSPIWPNGLGVFGFQAVGASTAQVGDGGGGGEALAFSVRPLGITTTPVKAWQVGLDTSNGSAAVGVQLGATAASGSNIPGQAIVSYYFDSTSASQSVTAQTFSTGVNMSGLKWSGTTAITTYQLRSAGNVNLEVTETAAGGGTLNLIAANDALSTAIPFALIYSTGSIGAFTSTTTLNGTYNLGGIVNGGVATKYVCVDASSNIVVQVAAC